MDLAVIILLGVAIVAGPVVVVVRGSCSKNGVVNDEDNDEDCGSETHSNWTPGQHLGSGIWWSDVGESSQPHAAAKPTNDEAARIGKYVSQWQKSVIKNLNRVSQKKSVIIKNPELSVTARKKRSFSDETRKESRTTLTSSLQGRYLLLRFGRH